MRRREFIALLGTTTVVWPLVAHAQQPPMPVIGYLGSESPDLFASRLRVFLKGLSTTGYDEGRNVAIEYRWAEGHNDRLPALAADLLGRKVAVIFTPASVAAALAAKAATSTTPIVFEVGVDPVGAGLVVSMEHPGGNVTGVTSLNAEVGPKRLELLHQLIPTATSFALLVNPTNPKSAEAAAKDLQAAAGALGVQLHVLYASTERDFDPVFAMLVQLRPGGLVIGNDPFLATHSEQLAALVTRHAVPAIHQSRKFVAAGGLVSYGGSIRESHYQAGVYTGRVLKGENPTDLPVQQITKVEMAININAAKSLGLEIPPSLLARADEVIE